MVGAAVAALCGAAIAIAVVALFGRDLIGAAAPDTTRIAAVEAKLDAASRDLAALRASAGQAVQPVDTSAIEARLDEFGKAIQASGARSEALETEIRTLAERPVPAAADTGATDALASRIDAAESKLGQLATTDALAAVGARVDGVVARVDGVGATVTDAVKPLDERLTALDGELKARPVGDPGARLVVALGALDQALAAGRPLDAELAAVKSAGGDVPALDALGASGAPTKPALAAELERIMAGLPPVRVGENASVFQRFVANAGSIVKVTPKDAPADAGPAAARQRVSAKAAAGDIAGALKDRDGLDDAAKAATEGWSQKAQSRIAAELALADARSAALARLGSN